MSQYHQFVNSSKFVNRWIPEQLKDNNYQNIYINRTFKDGKSCRMRGTNQQIWLENNIINDTVDNGGITLSGYDSGVISDGLNIINELYPAEISLQQNYPNPFNPKTNISWTMPSAGSVSIEIYNLKGQLIDVLYNGFNKPGNHEIIWNASHYSSGIYFYRLTFNETVLQKNMILLR